MLRTTQILREEKDSPYWKSEIMKNAMLILKILEKPKNR